MPRAIDWMLWLILHLLYSLSCNVSAFILRLLGLFTALKKENSRIKAIIADKPLCVAVVLESQEVAEKEVKIPQLLFWLRIANVSHVTLYDAAGSMKRSQVELEKKFNSVEAKNNKIHCLSDEQAEYLSELQGSPYFKEVLCTKKKLGLVERSDRYVECELSSLRRRTSVSPVSDFVGEQSESDSPAVNRMKVEFLSLQDGKESLVRAARHVCENAYKTHYAEQSMKAKKLTEEDINRSLKEIGCEGPDPDLLLLFGVTRSLLGFPPWRLRLTEIVHMGSLKDLTPHSFVSALTVFSKKKHKYGK